MGRRLIDTDAAYAVLTDYYHHSTDTQHAALKEALGRVESVDAVPVVRCRDCKRYQHEVGDDEYALGWCPFITIHLVSRNGFCAWGKRKEDGNAAD